MERILFLGGDNRMITAMGYLKSKGYVTSGYGLLKDDYIENFEPQVAVFPVPATRDMKTVNCPLTDKVITFSELAPILKNKLILSGGKIPIEEEYINYCDDDYYAVMNAIPTAEGAIAYCIENTPYTLFGSKVLIVGNGRVAKVLIERLRAFRCKITVSARKPLDFALLESSGIKHIETSSVNHLAEHFDIIFNTVDIELFDDIKKLKNTFLIDLSSKGCLDFEKAKLTGIKAVKLPGIPGKTAPLTSGKILARTLIRFIEKN